MKNPYEVLGLAAGASDAEVKAAHRKLAMEWHPDRHGGSAEATAKVSEINAARDAILTGEWQKSQQPQQQNFHQSGFQNGFGFPPQFDEILRAFHAQQTQRNRDLQADIHITLEQAFYGHEGNLKIVDGHNVREIKIKIPAGVDTGNRLRVVGGGEKSIAGVAPGDLYVTVQVNNGSRFQRVGKNLVLTQKIGVFDAILGTTLRVVGINGMELNLTIPPLTNTGTHFRIAGHGMVGMNDPTRGDLLVIVELLMPASITNEQVALLRQITSPNLVETAI